MNRITITTCPLCGQKHIQHKLDCKDFSISQEDFSLFCCDDCGFVFTQNFPDESVIGSYYEASNYVSHSNTHKGFVNKCYHLARTFMLRRKANLVKRITRKKQGRLLDYGAGTGYFANAMSKRKWKVTAIEKSSQARFFSLENFKLRMLDETALTTLPEKSFDVITLWHVMEHVQEINGLWEQLYRLLDDDGVLVVAVPNYRSTDARHYGKYWAAYDVPRHLWHFSPTTMQQFGQKFKFILEKQHRMSLDAFYVSMLSEKYKKSWFPLIKGIYFGIVCWIASLNRKGSCSSIIYVFRK